LGTLGNQRVSADDVDWLDELRLDPAPPFLTMGTRSLDLDRWLVIDDDLDRDIAYKRDLIARRRDVVVGHVPGSDDASREVLELVAAWRGVDPDLARPGVVEETDLDEHPIVRAALLVQDDLVVMQQIDGEWILGAGAVCFPSHWSLDEKLGLPLALIHSPVAHYERELSEKVDRFHDRLAVARPAWRRNWTVNATDELHLPSRARQVPPPERIEPDGSPMWIRSERQTLRRLAGTGAILFTIRIQRAPLGVLVERPEIAGRMLTAVRSWDASKRRYNSTGGALPQLIAWLEVVAGVQ